MLSLDRVSASYSSFHLGPLDLTVGREVVAVLGPSGCGKTTLLRIVAGIVASETGRLLLDGEPMDARPIEARQAALVFQESAVFPHMTARANIAYAATHSEQVEEMAQLLEITDVLDQAAHTLSGGERRRVEVARALAAAPRVLLLDEPTSGLDAPIKERLRDQLRAVLSERNIPVLYVTHDQREAAAVADRIAVMEDGQLHQVATPPTIFTHPATPFVAQFTGNTNVLPARVLPADSHPRVAWNGHSIRVEPHEFAPGADVWLCIRPGHIRPVAGDGHTGGTTLPAVLRDRVYEGDTYALTLAVEGKKGEASDLQVRMLAATFQQLGVRPPVPLPVYIDPAATHLMARTASVDGRSAAKEHKKQTFAGQCKVQSGRAESTMQREQNPVSSRDKM